jgi:hypothetical protein
MSHSPCEDGKSGPFLTTAGARLQSSQFIIMRTATPVWFPIPKLRRRFAAGILPAEDSDLKFVLSRIAASKTAFCFAAQAEKADL